MAPRTRALPFITFAAVLLAAGTGAAAAQAVPNDPASVVHALNRLTFGPRPGDADHVRQMGLARWIDQQLQPATMPDAQFESRLAPFETLSLSSTAIATTYTRPAVEKRRGVRVVIEQLASAKLLRATYSERQLEAVLADFWFNHFNVFARKGRTSTFITAYERDAIRPHVLGRFRDLLAATASSPAMLFYLDNWQSAAPAAAGPATRRPGPGLQTRQRGLNENYARELLELHTLGVDAGYTQTDVTEVARAFTGWTIDPRTQAFRFAPALHDQGEKLVLGHTLKAGGGIGDGERVLDIVAQHPATARHIATKLAQRFVSDTPPPALVDRAAARFRETDGNLREVLRTIVTSPEFFAAEARGSKVKTPLEFVVSAVRATGADITNTTPWLRSLQQLGMPLYLCQPPTGYADTADAWVSSGALVNRMNVALELEQTTGQPGSALVIGSPAFQRR